MATRKLTMEQDRAVVALMKTTYSEATGKTWVFPTDASVRLEREYNGSLDAARERVAKFKQENETWTKNSETNCASVISDEQIVGDAEEAMSTPSMEPISPPIVTSPVCPTKSVEVVDMKPRSSHVAPVYKLFSACATKQHAHCTGAHFETDGTRVVCTCKHHRQPDMFQTVKSVQAGFSFLK